MKNIVVIFFLSLLLISCAHDPRKIDVELQETMPTAKVTSYTQALSDLGLMTEIYGSEVLKIQSNPIGDNTGTSANTGGEIPKDITEIMKSSLNSIGGNIVYIPYDPVFIQNQMATGYSGFGDKIIPDVILSGGITEFDRGLVSRSDNTDASAELDINGLPNNFPSKNISGRYGDSAKEGLSRITLDFNLLNFQTMTGIPKMNTVNSMEVHKALAGQELAISLFGQTFGLKGSVKKVQGRHAAVRMLVELSMIQIIGKHLVLPYWRLLGDESVPDKIVLDKITKFYNRLNDAEVVYNVQSWLYLYGYNVPLNGILDANTQNVLMRFNANLKTSGRIDLETFLKIYIKIPINHESFKRREMYAKISQQNETTTANGGEVSVQPQEEQANSQNQPAQQQLNQDSDDVTEQDNRQKNNVRTKAESAPQAVPVTSGIRRESGKKIGRILSDDEW